MTILFDYQMRALLYESANSLVYRGCRKQDGLNVILKILKPDYPTPEELTKYKQEYQIARSLNLEHAIAAYSLEKYLNTWAIVFEDFGGLSLNLSCQDRKLSLKEFLEIAIKITAGLAAIHAANIIHKDINPSNIVFNSKTGQVKIIDFGISTFFPRENPVLKNPKLLEGTPAYISPEQTGRMNRFLDYRTDFYSLGVTFYELLTSGLPFNTKEPLELIHSHLARQPKSPDSIDPKIPPVLAEIVMKLLAKNAEDRYQSAWGIKADLESCWQQFQNSGKIELFPLASQDISDKFQISQKLYGREKEIKTLHSVFSRVAKIEECEEDECSRSKSEMVLVSGYSGMGKSVLVKGICPAITAARGYFLVGKFDRERRDVPYSAIIQAFRKLVEHLLTETEERLDYWRAKIIEALGVNARVIVEAISEIEFIIGKQPPAPYLPAIEAQNRFNLVFEKFIEVFARREHPLVIFLDDLQWADRASLNLLLKLSQSELGYLLVIGAYRDNEIDSEHPLQLTIDEISKAGALSTRISLKPLTGLDLNQLIADSFKCDREMVEPLAELVSKKTAGNPFFVKEFLGQLYAEKLINFNYDCTRWQWESTRIQARNLTDNVIGLLVLKLNNLPDATRDVLQIAACIGERFESKQLAIISNKSLKETVPLLRQAVVEGLILPQSNNYESIESDPSQIDDIFSIEYQFAHDRIQQAAYSLIPVNEKNALHGKIGQLLLQNTPPERLEEKIFDIVNQLNSSIDSMLDCSKRDELARLNLIAGKKAKSSAAYEAAFNYFYLGSEVSGKDGWKRQYDLTLNLYIDVAETAYLCARFEQMEIAIQEVLQKSTKLLDRVKVYEVKIEAHIARNQFREALDTGIAVLDKLGIKLPSNPNKFNIVIEVLKLRLALSSKAIEGLKDLVELPEITIPSKLAALQILQSIGAAAYFAFPMFYPLIALKQFNLLLRYGNSPISSTIAIRNGAIFCGLLEDFNSGYEFGQIALKLLLKFDAKEYQAKILVIFNNHIKHWKCHIKETLPFLLEGYRSGLETGDIQFAAYGAAVYCWYSYLIGKELFSLEREMSAHAKAIARLKQDTALNYLQVFHQTVLNLIGKGKNPCSLIGEAYNEQTRILLSKQTNDRAGIFGLYFVKLMLCYLFGEYDRAYEYSKAVEKYLDSVRSSALTPVSCFYDSLVKLSLITDIRQSKKHLLKQVSFNQKKMKKWARSAPMNYAHKYYLVEAERNRILDCQLRAIECYEKAISLAKKNEYIQEEALAYELAAKFYLARNNEVVAKAYLKEARYCYQHWGAIAKVKHLEQTYPELLVPTASSFPSKTNYGSLDLGSILAANQVLSSEIDLDVLLEKLMGMVIENAGACKGFLILRAGDNWAIVAEGSLDSDRITIRRAVPIDSLAPDLAESILPMTIVNYVIRTQKDLVLNNAAIEGQFTRDSYILSRQPQSVLCTPLLHQGKPIGLLYLENKLSAGAFTSDRLEILTTLCSQAVISLQNARLVRDLKQEIGDRQRAEQNLRASEAKIAQFLEAIPVGISIVEACGKPYYLNSHARELLGKGLACQISVEQIPEVYQLYLAGTEQIYPASKLSIVRALKGEIFASSNDIEIRREDKIIPIEVRSTSIRDESGNIIYAIAAFSDITSRKMAEAARKRAIEAENRALELELDNKRKSLDTLKILFDEIHNQPLNDLKFLIKSLKDGEAPSSLEQLLDRLEAVDRKLRNIYDRQAMQIKNSETSLYLAKEVRLDLKAPLSEILYQVYHHTIIRPLPHFQNLRILIPNIASIEIPDLSVEDKLYICRFLESSLCNVGEHALGATRLKINFIQNQGSYILSIEDNGKGLSPDANDDRRLGTKNALDLAKKLGGQFCRVSPSSFGTGTVCELSWPIAKNDGPGKTR